jgi:hypothetical protein
MEEAKRMWFGSLLGVLRKSFPDVRDYRHQDSGFSCFGLRVHQLARTTWRD